MSRLNKLDSFFLWVASLSGIGFSIFISYLKLPWIPYLPIFILIAYSLVIGYLRGAVFFPSFTERVRGWNYLFLGLSTYLPLTVTKFGAPYIEPYLGDNNFILTYLQPFATLLVVAFYLVLSRKIVTPAIYRSFSEPFDVVTKKILSRTSVASLYLGLILYTLVLALSTQTTVISIGIYIAFILLLAFPLFIEEQRVKKLLMIEKYQSYVEIETLQRKKANQILGIAIGTVSIVMAIILALPQSDLKVMLLLVLLLVFIITMVAFLVSLLLFSDKGDMIKTKDNAEMDLNQQGLADFRKIVNAVNS